MTRRFTSEIVNEIGPEKDIPAPDVGTTRAMMAWIFDTYSMNKGHSVLGVVTGKPLTIGGSLGREEATARGALFCIARGAREARTRDRRADGRRAGLRQRRQLPRALRCTQEGATVVAISDSTGGALQPERASTSPAAFAHKRERGTLAGLDGRRGDHERGAAAARLRHPRAVRARAGDHRARTPTRSRRGSSARARTARPRPPPTRSSRTRASSSSRRARERGRRRRLLLRVGAGPPGVLLEGGRGEREAQRHRRAGVRRDLGRPRRAATCRMRVAAYGLAVQRVAEATVTRGSTRRRVALGTAVAPSRRAVYDAAGCHLCERAPEQRRAAAARRARLRAARGRHRRRSRSSRPRYREWIPVVEIDGERRFVYHVARRTRLRADAVDHKLGRRPTPRQPAC